jgi:uncharacterized membrane protein YgaE (UPF0421/DUF939 family)
MTRAAAATALQLATRAAAGALISVLLAQWFGLEFPLYAMIAAVIVTDLSPVRTRQLALPRLAGTVLGACVGALAVRWLGTGALAIAVGVLIAMFVAQASGWAEAAKLAGYVCGLVVLEHSAEPWTYALYRFIETVLGIAVAVGISLVPKLVVLERAKAQAP